MNTMIIATVCMLLSAFAEYAPARMEKMRPVKPEESERVLKQILDRSIPMYKKFRGIESLRKETIREYNPATNELKSTSEITARRRDFFYIEPEIEVLSLIKDGKEKSPSGHRNYKAKPAYPIFDERWQEHYDLAIEERIKIDGKECYCIRVTPKKATEQHFTGNVYFTVKGLDPVLMEGTIAKLGFPVKELRIELKIFLVEGVPAASSGSLTIRLKVPLFYPDTRIISTFTSVESKAIE